MNDFPRLIEHAFPLKQASLDSVHEKNVRHGHISTLHIWPARRPLAACRAALIATLLPDPSAEEMPDGMSDEAWQQEIARKRRELCEKIGGTVERKVDKKTGRVKEVTKGGVLHWHGKPKKKGDERIIQQQAEDIEWFREEIRKVYSRAPRVLDPFAGGGAIPLEAMRLGCAATAVDINPVAWFILKCTLEYPQKLAGQTLPLPEFILHDDDFMRSFFQKAKGYTKAEVGSAMKRLHKQLNKKSKGAKGEEMNLPFAQDDDHADELHADLAWHVRAWGQWVLAEARKKLAKYYPVYADFEPVKKGFKSYETRPMQFVPLKDDGTPNVDALNDEFSEEYLENKQNPRWVPKPTVAYLWARTVTCKNCRATVPLLKTRWLCRKDKKRVLLSMQPNAERTGVQFSVETHVPVKGGNAAQRREHDKRISAGTMSRAGAKCPCCDAIMTTEDIRLEGKENRLRSIATAVVVDGQTCKEFRLPTSHEKECAAECEAAVASAFTQIPFGIPDEPTPGEHALGMRVPKYGFSRWCDLFTTRQLVSGAAFAETVRRVDQAGRSSGYPAIWVEAMQAMLGAAFDRFINYLSTLCIWEVVAAEVKQTFLRFALPITWDFAEANPLSPADRYFSGAVSNVYRVLEQLLPASASCPAPRVLHQSAVTSVNDQFDLILTDPPYYDAIPYSDLMDFFYVWLRRTLAGTTVSDENVFANPLSPKWDQDADDGELIDDSSRHNGDRTRSKRAYEDGMERAFRSCNSALNENGRLVIVFAHKQPDAWETLAGALIRAGFVVDGSWPIVTEMRGGIRNFGRASLASSVWLVCKKRPALTRPGWDNSVLDEMREKIGIKLREFWDAGIRGPDFIWSATGPALEAYSKYPVVKKADGGGVMSVSEFLNHVRRLVVDYIVGQVLSGGHAGDADIAAADRLDEPTAYYLLHRNDFGVDEAPVGAVILYATACGVSDRELMDTWDILAAGKAKATDDREEEADPDEDAEGDGDSGAKVKLKTWAQRKGKSMGHEAPGGKPVPLIDRIHRLMHLWKAGDVRKVDEYIDDNGLRRHELFKRVLQSLIELSQQGTDERSVLESISNHIGIRGVRADVDQTKFEFESSEVS
jgi:putative DNA methylase